MTTETTLLGDRGAVLSDDGRYRYLLWRRWDKAKPRAVFIMLNPSTADHQVDDPTIRKCVGFARRWGMGGIRVANLFAFRATDPKGMWGASDPIGEGFEQQISRAVDPPNGVHIAAWGADGRADSQAKRVRGIFYDSGLPLFALRLTKDGRPWHPLYIPYDITPVVYEPARHDLKVGEAWPRSRAA